MKVTFRLLELSGTEWLETREYAPGTSDDVIQSEAEAWASGLYKCAGELSWWVEDTER